MSDPNMIDDVLDDVAGVIVMAAADHPRARVTVAAAEAIATEVLMALTDRGWGPTRQKP